MALVTIILSTALNAAYFLPIVYMAWFAKEDDATASHGEAPWPAVTALALTAILTIGFFLFHGPALDLERQVVEGMS